ncbi:V-type proton ATPase 116 kDa subunit a1-like isoform X2 [Homarus americanus]|uniref:V-type proton ATPase 116 kDa subunit a1-like isoform X2 n=1 Tax=Homarus americanus TaxID=6706 RepID=UPI001C446CEC|nr:V-type proton ATPase 116 kDa subunit a1-like isoform X2 [Homarus americanus]
MGSLFRSEEMALCQLFLQSESAYTCVSELGELGLVQFRDLNPDVNAFQRKFVNEVRRCDEMERKLRYLEREIRKDGIPVLDTGENPEAPMPREMIDLEVKFEKLENELKEVNSNAEALKRNYLELTELKHILKKTQVFFDEREGSLESGGQTSLTQNLLPEDSKGPIQLGFVAGVILRERIPAFERMLWRACRGNVFLRQAEMDDPLEDPASGEQVYKSVFIIFFQGDHLKMRVKKICEGFRATMYPCPEAPADRREMAMGVKTRLDDLNTVLSQTQDHRHRVLVSAARNIRAWMMKVWKIKSIYHTLNMFNLDVIQNGLIAECWIPVANLEDVQLALRRGTEKSGSLPAILNRLSTHEAPPTFHRTNKFTKAFQTLIDSYGVATYREINPAPYTIITFPFLFAVMFGDVGHGIIMALFGGWMVWREKPLAAKKTDNEIWNIFFGGRYIILLMGLFSMYTGLIYNDIFSKSMNLFGSSWHGVYDESTIEHNKELILDPGNREQYSQTPYPFGLDPMWQLSTNKINFYNSYKMKISIIFGIIHMMFGVILSVWNHRFFDRSMNIYCEFIPQVLFLTCLFVYMVFLVFHKWVWYGALGTVSQSSSCAPSILITFINMVLVKGYQDHEGEDCSPYMFAGQFGIQRFLLIVALLCVPWMLCVKPFLLHRNNKRRQLVTQANGGEGMVEEGGEAAAAAAAAAVTEELHDMGEVMIHQGIHTIEYVLGSVSHTASYLRLWALSLAHAQLSEVLWSMVLQIGLTSGGEGGSGGIVMYLIFAFWAFLTVAILVLMEGLSAFLHTLRLHWVEFQSKFYGGTGYPFVPFAFETILDQAENAVVEQ